MSDPYQILGIPRSASDDEIKKAYRALSRRYHPDANVNNPNKAQAEEKFKEIQAAYQQIMKEKEQGESGFGWGNGSFEGYGGYGGYQQADTDQSDMYLRAAANYINSRHYREAQNVLNNISDRDARWYYFNAVASAGLGNNVEALEHAKRAAAMEPQNMQYQNLVQQLEYGGTWYQSMQSPYGQPVNLGNNLCLKLCIANLVCNLCCGGGGMCCGGTGMGGPYPGGF